MLRLAITRTSDQLTSLAERAAQRGVQVVPLPIIAIRQIPFPWPRDLKADRLDWVFFTSANGVVAFFTRLAELGIALCDRTKLAAVGKKTAVALENFGLTADFVPSDAYGQMLFEEYADNVAVKGETVVYARGAEVNFDPARLLLACGVTYVPLVCYETIGQAIEAETIAQLTGNDYILFTAPSTVDAYQEQFGKPLAKPIAIGRSTAAQMNQYGWFGFITMKRADINNILEYL